MMDSFHNPFYSIGCPVWNCDDWRGWVYPKSSGRDRWLSHYSHLFNTVEGNSTFYGLPALETVQGWAHKTREGFLFCFKFPGELTHQQALEGFTLSTLDHFLKILDVLNQAQRLGPSFIQLPPTFGPSRKEFLFRFLDQLPEAYPYAVEVRHPDWFREPHQEDLTRELASRQVDRVIFDSRPLFSRPPSDATEQESQRRKPRLSVAFSATASRPMLRLIGRNNVGELHEWIPEWVNTIANWVEQGKRPIVFTHTPDDQFAPNFARMLHDGLVRRLSSLTPLDQWPHQAPIQRQLF